jgi:hypothetical protein
VGGVMPHSFSSTGLPSLVEIPVALEDGVAVQVSDRSSRFTFRARVVAPLFRIADLVADHGEFFFSFFFGSVAHPGQGFDVVGKGFFEGGYKLVHAGLRRGRKILLDPVLAHGLAEGAVGHSGALLPARRVFFCPGEGFAEEGKVFVIEGLGQVHGRAVNQMPAEVGLLPRITGSLSMSSFKALKKSGVATLRVSNGRTLMALK